MALSMHIDFAITRWALEVIGPRREYKRYQSGWNIIIVNCLLSDFTEFDPCRINPHSYSQNHNEEGLLFQIAMIATYLSKFNLVLELQENLNRTSCICLLCKNPLICFNIHAHIDYKIDWKWWSAMSIECLFKTLKFESRGIWYPLKRKVSRCISNRANHKYSTEDTRW